MTPQQVQEAHIRYCVEEITKYCREHTDSCDGCILYQCVSILGLDFHICRLFNIPNMREKGSSDE